MKMRFSRLLGAIGLVGGLALGMSGAANAATTTKGGLVHVWSTGSGIRTPILITGAIADYGTGISQDKNGKLDANGLYEKAVLKKGSFIINSSGLAPAMEKAQPIFNSTNCSASLSGTGPTTIVPGSGTGAYVGIKGTVVITLTLAFIEPKLANGKCNQSANPPSASSYSTATGSGTLSF
jgi:hypothetical protein